MVATLVIHVLTLITTYLPIPDGWNAEFAWLYTVIVRGYNIFVCILNASQSDRAKSKLEYCGATWLYKNDWLLSVGDYSNGTNNHKHVPDSDTIVAIFTYFTYLDVAARDCWSISVYC